ncbi:ribonuclease III [Aurantivibrio plasticivorans]
MNDLSRERLLRSLSYQFGNPQLFIQALTHRSAAPQHNERLEFLGDSLLGVFIAEYLYTKFPKAKEGQLSRLRSQLVKGETLAEIAREFELGESIILGEGELKSGGHRRASILADCTEAIIGAIYLDSDFETCKRVVLPWFASRLESIVIDKVAKDPKSTLQELLQSKGQPLPEYEVINVDGKSHEQVFTVSCKIQLLNQPKVVSASSRKQAEKLAAEAILQELNS